MRFTATLLFPFLAGLCLASPAPAPSDVGESSQSGRADAPACNPADPSNICGQVTRFTWLEGEDFNSPFISPVPLIAGVQYSLAFKCDRLRRLIGVKISQDGLPLPTRFTVVDKTQGSLPFKVSQTGPVRFDFTWQIFSLESSRLRTTLPERQAPEPPASIPGPVMPGAPQLTTSATWAPQPTRAAWLNWEQASEIRRTRGELAIFAFGGVPLT